MARAGEGVLSRVSRVAPCQGLRQSPERRLRMLGARSYRDRPGALEEMPSPDKARPDRAAQGTGDTVTIVVSAAPPRAVATMRVVP